MLDWKIPDWKTIVRERIACLELKGPAESDLVEELAQHLEDKYQELLSGGTDQSEAHRQTLTELDNLYPLEARFERNAVTSKNETTTLGETSRGNLFGDLARDLRHSFRGMRKNPVFVLFVILPLALGIGANTAVFTIFDTVILNPLPVPDSASLVVITMTDAKDRAKTKAILPVSYADLKDYATKNEVFSAVAGYTGPRIVTFENGGASERMFSELVTGNYFSTLKLKPALGRFFTPEEDGAPGAHPVAVMNYSTWRGRFGGDKDIIGKTLRLNNTIFTVVGIAPPKFIGVNAIFGPNLWMPAAMAEQVFPTELKGAFTDRSRGLFEGVGRLKPGVKLKQANANIVTVAASLAREYPETNAGKSAIVRPVSDVIFGSASSSSSPMLFGTAMLLVVVGIILLIACSNVANLLLARSVSRQREMAVRLAIGASRSRLLKQLMTENVLCALLGGIAGLAIGYPGLQLLWSRVIPFEVSANMLRPNFDAAIFVYTLVISVATGFVFGTVPALQASRASVGDALKEESHSVGRSKRKVTFSSVLLAGQVALSFLLLLTASLFLRSIAKAYQTDPGFQTRNLAVFLTNPGQAGYSKPQTEAFYKNVRDRVATMPGVHSVSWASNLPLWSRLADGFQIEGREVRSKSETITAILNIVDSRYFETAGVPLIKGREFQDADTEDSTPVAIVNQQMAQDYWPRGNALGKRIRLPGETIMRQIVGIARTANYSTLGEPPQSCVYLPRRQHYSDGMTLFVRTTGAPEQVMPAIQREMRLLGPHIMINDVRTGRTIIDNGLFNAKVGVALLTVFGLLALGLASVGLYGAMAYSVTQRKREIGVRMALGAARRNVLQLVLRQGMSLVATGMLVGFGGVLLIGRLLRGMLYGLSASDPLSVAAAAFVLLAVALLACYLPARRASRVDPLVALRES